MRKAIRGSIGAEYWRMSQGKIHEGVFAINKPTGISSAQVLRDCQKQFNPSSLFSLNIKFEEDKRREESHNQRNKRRDKEIKLKIGHGGTLDPLATGVLIAGVGSGTKALGNFLHCTKTYDTVVLFGAATDTYDRLGKLVERAPYGHVTREVVESALGAFRGKVEQLPPLYSALKMDGKPLYEYARSGKPIPREIKKRPVEVLEMQLLEWMEGGSHKHKAPTEEVSKAEKRVAKGVWEKANIAPGSPRSSSLSPSRKRKMESESEDDLVSQRPPPKHGRKGMTNGIKAEPEEPPMMSGGLAGADASESVVNDMEAPSESVDKGPPAARIRMTVTSGFYVRSFCHDLGAAVGSAALMAELVRTRQAQFELGKNVLEYEELSKGEYVWGPQVEALLDQWTGSEKNPSRKAEEPVEVKEVVRAQRQGSEQTEVKVEVKEELKEEAEEAQQGLENAKPTQWMGAIPI